MLHQYIEREDIERTSDALPGLIAAAEAAANHYDSLSRTAERCRKFLDNLPEGTVISEYVAMAQPLDNPQQTLNDTRARISAATKERDALDAIPIPSADIEARTRDFVAELAMRAKPYVRGVARGGKLSVRWPLNPASTVNDTRNWPQDTCNPLMLAALLHPDELAQVILNEIEREANQILPIKQRQQRIVELTAEIEELQREASDIVYELVLAGGAETYHQAGPAAVLGVLISDERQAAA